MRKKDFLKYKKLLILSTILASINSSSTKKLEEKTEENFVLENKTITMQEDIPRDLLNTYVHKNTYLSEKEEFNKTIDVALFYHLDEEGWLSFYSSVYSLNPSIVKKIIKEISNNFSTVEYLNYNVVSLTQIKGRDIIFSSKELALLCEVRNIYYNYESYGYTKEEICGYHVSFLTDLDYQHQINEICSVVGVDPILVYSMCKVESNFSSQIFLEKNNPAGIRFSTEWEEFPTSYSGFIETALEVLKYNLDGKNTIEKIGETYAPTTDEANNSWVEHITSTYELTMKNDEVFSLDEEQNKLVM